MAVLPCTKEGLYRDIHGLSVKRNRAIVRNRNGIIFTVHMSPYLVGYCVWPGCGRHQVGHHKI